MAWYDEAVFYHIYPLGLAGAPETNPYGAPVHRLRELIPWIGHIRDLDCTALYIGPLFESVGHGYETTDYRLLDTRLGTNEDLREFVRLCHEAGLRVILDGVFNHTGRDFFAYRDIRENRERSRYLGWYRGVDLRGNNSFGDGFSCENWGGYELLPRLELRNPDTAAYHLDTVRFWVSEFDIDGLRLDAADVLDFDFIADLRRLADSVKEDFWLMGEVIHGDYTRWVGGGMLRAVTNYQLHKALYSAHNDRNYFEIAHTVKRQLDMGLRGGQLYSFADNHDVERIMTKLRRREHYLPVHVLLYTLPGIPSIYYGSEFGVEARTENGRLRLELGGNGGEIWVPQAGGRIYAPVRSRIEPEKAAEPADPFRPRRAEGKPYEQMDVEELQAEILAKLAANGPVTDRMRREVSENVYRDSLLNWVYSFR